MRAPDFWRRDGALARLLSPCSLLVAAAARVRAMATVPWRAPVPVICVGNPTVGGSGKTPVVLALAALLAARGVRAHALSRGYGGRAAGPLRVDRARHAAQDVGDEPLLLAEALPTWVARDRAAGARAAVAAGAAALLLDDGLQNPRLEKDLSLAVIDGGYGLGNGRVMPAGPLREPLGDCLAKVRAVVVVGDDRTGLAARLAGGPPVLAARLVPDLEAAERLAGRRVVAFAGIGRPSKFFETLAEAGAEVVGRFPFPDHHPYTPDEVMRLVEAAEARGAELVTTSKDHVRLPSEAQAMARPLPVTLVWGEPGRIAALLDEAVGRG